MAAAPKAAIAASVNPTKRLNIGVSLLVESAGHLARLPQSGPARLNRDGTAPLARIHHAGSCGKLLPSEGLLIRLAEPLQGIHDAGSFVRIGKCIRYGLDQRFATDFNEADQLFFYQIVDVAIDDKSVRETAAVNLEDKIASMFRYALERLRIDQNEKIFVRFTNDAPFRNFAMKRMAAEVYRRLNREGRHQLHTSGENEA